MSVARHPYIRMLTWLERHPFIAAPYHAGQKALAVVTYYWLIQDPVIRREVEKLNAKDNRARFRRSDE